MIKQSIDGTRTLTGAGWTLLFWAGWWLSLVLIYLFLSGSTLFTVLLASNLGNVLVLAASVAYCRAEAFRIKDMLPLLLLVLVASILGSALTKLIPGPSARLVAIAPSAVVSTAAMIAIGWSVLVRCGWGTAPFFVLMSVYACLQLPAFVDAMVLRTGAQPYLFPSGFNVVRNTFFHGLVWVFYFLAFFKVIIALSFLGYFYGPEHDPKALSSVMTWPSEEVRVSMHPTYARLLKYGAGLVGSMLVGLFLSAVAPAILPTLQKLVTLRN